MQGQCSNCNGRFEIVSGQIGQQAQCPHCKAEIVIQPVSDAAQNNESLETAISPSTMGQQSGQGAGNLKPIDYYVKVLKNYVNFSGRASRREFWFFTLFNFLISLILYIIGSLIGAETIIRNLYGLAVFLPGLAVSIRRLHDINKSGWWYLIIFLPIIGGIWLLIYFCSEGTTGPNQYGDDPYGVSS